MLSNTYHHQVTYVRMIFRQYALSKSKSSLKQLDGFSVSTKLRESACNIVHGIACADIA